MEARLSNIAFNYICYQPLLLMYSCAAVCLQVASSLSERSSLLAGLHRTLPRPITNAEQQLDKQLEVSRWACGLGVTFVCCGLIKLLDHANVQEPI